MELEFPLQNTTQNGMGIPIPKHSSKWSGDSHSKTQLKMEWQFPFQTLLKMQREFPHQNTIGNGLGIPNPKHNSKLDLEHQTTIAGFTKFKRFKDKTIAKDILQFLSKKGLN